MKIKAAAIEYNYVIYFGKSHASIGHAMIERGVIKPPFPSGDAQGFITDTDEFVSRTKALQIAIDAGQVIKGKTSHPTELFSEDLKDLQ